MADATVAKGPAIPLIAADSSNVASWVIRAAKAINGLLRGRDSSTMTVTLAASATTSIIYDERLSLFSFVGLAPQTATAAAALASGSLYVVPAAGQAVIHHPSTADSDKIFACCIRG